MAKLFKLSAYIVDAVGDFDAENLEDYIMWRLDDVSVDHIHITETDIGEWDDELPINYYNCPEAEYEKYFKETQLILDNIAPSPQVMHDKITAELHQKLIDQLGIKFKKEN